MADGFLWMIYNQLGTHMWKVKRPTDPNGRYVADEVADIYEENWRKRMLKARACGANAVYVDIGEMLRYPSHPEIWVKGAWSAEKMNEWVRWLKSIGFTTVMPSLNFSTAHHLWLGEYSRMVSTPEYYRVCRDVIRDAYEVFEHPRIMDIGMDEENAAHCSKYFDQGCIVIRQGDLYWHDNLFYIREIESLGAQAATSADMIRYRQKEFAGHMPKSVLMHNWFYGRYFEREKFTGSKGAQDWAWNSLQGYAKLEEEGYDQMMNASNWLTPAAAKANEPPNDTNIVGSVAWGLKNLTRSRFKGLLVSPWFGVKPQGDAGFFAACDQLAQAKALYEETTAKEKQS